MKLSGIKIIVWDFDNTLYPSNPTLADEIREAELKLIMHHTGWDRDESNRQFTGLYRRIFFSATQVAAHLSKISVAEAAGEMEQYFNRDPYLSRDERLISMFAQLSNYRHIILSNGLVSKITSALQVLGVPAEEFELIASSELTGVNKPDPLAYQYIVNHTRLPPAVHLMVGDRDEVDIAPARQFGMHTALVWGESSLAEYSLPTVYDIPGILE
jgi:HAD superfamily hydrolase (TIGR01549 family)